MGIKAVRGMRTALWFTLGIVGMYGSRLGLQGSIPFPVLGHPGGTIAFSMPVEGLGQEISIMRADGSGKTAISGHPGVDVQPSWSPDGNRIAFSSYREGEWSLFVMDREGNDCRMLAKGGLEPAWSPDGRTLAFSRHISGSNQDIFTVGADGGAGRRLTDSPAFDAHPSWSPDGGRIAFQSDNAGSSGIYMMDVDTGSASPLVMGDGNMTSPSWSPDGTEISFVTDLYAVKDDPILERNTELMKVRVDGTGRVRLTDTPGAESFPTWSPDSRRILYGYSLDKRAALRVMDRNGHGMREVSAPGPSFDYSPASWTLR